MRRLLVPTLLLFGCAAPLQQKAHIVAQSSKEIIDAEYNAWDDAANKRVSDCDRKLAPAEDYTKSDYDRCVGPFNEGVQGEIVQGLKIVRAAQLALFLALAQDKSDPEIRQALVDLTKAVTEFIQLIQENR